MNSVSKVKIVVGYTLLLGVLFFSLFFVHREMENLMHSENQDVHWTDSLITLLREKDENTIYMLRVLSETSESMVSTSAIENIIATRKDSVVTNRRVQRRIITHRDTVVTKPKKKGFFRRLGEVFVPPKKDTAIQVKTSLEYATDTVIDVYNPVDSLQEKLRAVAQQKKVSDSIVRRRRLTLQRMDKMLTARIDSLLKGYEQEALQRAREEADYRQSVRGHSVKIISSIAVGAVLLSVFFLIIIGRDIARSNRYRRELEEARKRAEDLLAMREKMMLAITHDFKAPLGSIMGYADLLSRLTVDERQRFYLDNMKTSSEHLLKLVVDLLDFHRLDLHKAEINRVTFHPARLLEEIHVSFEPLTSAKGLELHCNIAPELEGTYISDPLRLRQIINNLLSNALKHTKAEDTISISVKKQKGNAIIEIQDTGSGIDATEIDKIFDRFYQTEQLDSLAVGAGTGIGLALTKGIIELHHGTISVESELGKGSNFIITLKLGNGHFEPDQISLKEEIVQQQEPLHPGVSAIMAEAALDNDIIPSQPSDAKMLIVEDDASIREMLADIFRTFYQVITASDGVEAMELVEKEMPSIVLSDVVMPRMSGTELCKQIKKEFNTCHIPVVLLTARTAVEHTVEGLRIGADDYITKPFNINILVSRCNNLVNSRIQLQEKFTRQPQAFAQILATNPMDKEMLDRAMAIIEQHLDNTDFNVNIFAREMGMARTNLFTKLKAVTGQTPNDFILSIRLKKGAVMLRNNPELNITEISDRIGFSSSRYFSKCFKEIYHVSPLAYRKGEEKEEEGNEETDQ